MKNKKLLAIRKVLMRGGTIRIGSHARHRMVKRGYFKGDLISAIMNGQIAEIQFGYVQELQKMTFKFVIEGLDQSGNPIVVVIAEGEPAKSYLVKTVMPPLDARRFSNCI